jgi:hypothetical protein
MKRVYSKPTLVKSQLSLQDVTAQQNGMGIGFSFVPAGPPPDVN